MTLVQIRNWGNLHFWLRHARDSCVTLVQWDLNVTVPKAFYVNIALDFNPYEVTVKETIALRKQLERFHKNPVHARNKLTAMLPAY